MSIPARRIVNVVPSVLSPGGNPLALNGVILTTSDRVPMGTVQSFPPGDAVGDFFGPTSIEATLAAKYFAGFSNKTSSPAVVYFAQYNEAAVEAYLRSGSFSGTTLAQLQALSGVIVVAIDGGTVTSANIDLSTATSFSNAASLIQTGLQAAGSKFTGTGTISNGSGGAGNTLNITAVTSGSLKVGDIVVGGPSPATITALGSGTGGIGTYTVGGAAQDFDPGGALTVASTATVTYDSQLARFLIHSPTTGDDSTIGFATGSLAVGLKLQAAQGAVLSQGADAATPAAFMPTITQATQNWAAFMTAFEPDTDDKLAFAQWVQTTQQRYAYVAWDTDVTVLEGDAPASFGAQVAAVEMDGIEPIIESADDDGSGRVAAFVLGTVGCIDYNRTNGRITFAFKGQAGLVPFITDETAYNNMLANGYNGYCDFATSADQFRNYMPGSTPGSWAWFDSYINQIWLNSALQLALVGLMTRINSLPYNSEGYNLVRAAAQDPIQRALNAGVIQPGVTLSNSQRAEINVAAGQDIADALQNFGYVFQILDASPEVRAARGSPPCTLWYTDGGSIQFIELASIAVQ
jgi:hypothetical protein